MPRRTTRRRAALALLAASFAAPQADVAHALTDFGMSARPARDAAREDRRPGLRALAAARSQIGSPYSMGATGPGAFDCSGLTTYAFRRAGEALPRDSFGQFGAGRAVEKGDIRAGDLVFFSTNGPGASHVGIATGKGTVVSATSSGVMEHSMSDAYWGSQYVGARRVT